MCDWQDVSVRKIRIDAQTVRDTCKIIHQMAQKKEKIIYTDLMSELKRLGHHGTNRGTIGTVVGEVSARVSQLTSPSSYPSAIVIRKDRQQPGKGFWELDEGTNPPNKIAPSLRQSQLEEYQHEVFDSVSLWNCDCAPSKSLRSPKRGR
jgi:hypothetical protein